MITRSDSKQLLEKYIEGENLRHHSRMVAAATEAYAEHLNKPREKVEDWWAAVLLLEHIAFLIEVFKDV